MQTRATGPAPGPPSKHRGTRPHARRSKVQNNTKITETRYTRAHLAEGDLAQEVVAHRVGTIRAHQRSGLQNVAQGLAHLVAVLGEEAVAVHALRQGKVCGGAGVG